MDSQDSLLKKMADVSTEERQHQSANMLSVPGTTREDLGNSLSNSGMMGSTMDFLRPSMGK